MKPEPKTLLKKRCLPCSGEIPPLSDEEIRGLMGEVPGWTLEKRVLKRTFRFKNFALLMDFVNRMAEIAESEGHHPVFTASYNVLDVSVWTHEINDLSENDFILAAKIGGLA